MLIILVIISIITQLLLSIFVLLQSRKSASNQLFVLISLSSVAWSVANFLSIQSLGSETLISIVRLILFFVVLQNTFFYLFAKSFPGEKWPLSKIKLIIFLISSIFVGLLTLSPFALTSVELNNDLTVTSAGPAMIFFVGHALFTIVLAFRELIQKHRHARGVKATQLQILIFASILIWILVPITNFALTPLLKTVLFINFAPVYTMAFTAIIGYAVVSQKLFDIKFAAVRTVVYGLSLAALAGMYYFMVYVVSFLLFSGQNDTSTIANPINIFLALILAFVFQPIRNFFDRVTNNVFYRDRYSTDEFYTKLSETLTESNNLISMLEQASNEFETTFKSSQALLIVAHTQNKYTIAGTSKHRRLPTPDIQEINAYVKEHGDKIIVTSLISSEFAHLKRILMSHKIEIMMPLVRRGDIMGYLALGEQLGSGYTGRDLKVLATISDELIIAIQNALSVQEVKDINANLEQRIHAATSELRTSNARLQRLDATKDEFLSMASHQLRTPLTSVKGYLSMMLEGDVGKTTPMQNKVLEEAFSSSERMVHLIHDFLNVSRLQTGKFMLELEPTDLVKLIEEEVKSLERVAKSRNMEIEFANKAGNVSLILDDNKIRQVVMNYIDNAIYYSHPETTIKVELSKKDNEVALKVKDTGIGVPPSEQARLFGKFYRATNARKQRPDGTGVGLFLAKKVIAAHYGDVLFESKQGKGSMFGFKLPVNQKKLLSKKDNTHKLVK
jgi:signal transduction histidine kinase